MNAKKARAIRKAMIESKDSPRNYGFTTVSVIEGDKRVRFRFTYHVIGQDRLYKLGKKIYLKHGVLPNANS
jgi:hypothetical protein